MSTADEILKLKQLLDSGAITEDEYNQMKKKLLEGGDSSKPAFSQPQQPVHQYTPRSSTYPTTNTYRSPVRKRYFNGTPFKVVGWISLCFTILFVLINIFLIANKSYYSSFYMVWETTFVPAGLALSMGIILKVKDDYSSLMAAAIIFLVISFVLSIVSTSLFIENPSSYYYY